MQQNRTLFLKAVARKLLIEFLKTKRAIEIDKFF